MAVTSRTGNLELKLLLEQVGVVEVLAQNSPTANPELTAFKKNDAKAENRLPLPG